MEKIIPSILAALIPFIATYLSKLNKASIHKNLMEDAQKKIDFLDKYFQVSSKFLAEAEIESLKLQLSAEMQEVKNQVSSLDKQENLTDYQRLTIVQKVFLTFSPASVMGWLWAVLFYITLVFTVFLFWGFSLDEASNFSTETFTQSIQDETSIFVFGFLMIPLLLFRWLAIREYKRKSNKN
ncbi:MAG: hypothetical protein Q8R96_01200 [Bacteroidota bacterium]|nr:hypothetical protein [Bacteroidota bacterium]